MKFLEINQEVIFTDNIYLLKKKKISIKNCYIFTFIGNDDKKNKIFNFYKLLDKDLHAKYKNQCLNIVNKFHNDLKTDLALKKNLTRLLYGQLGLYPYFHLLKKIFKTKNKFTLYTEDEKIYNLFKIIKNFNNIEINFFNKKNSHQYFKISKFELIKMYSSKEIYFYLKKKFLYNFKKFINLKKNVFVHLSTEINFLSLDKFINEKWQSKIFELESNYYEKLEPDRNNELNKILETNDIIIKDFFDDNIYFKKLIRDELRLFYLKYVTFYNKISKIFVNLNSNFYFFTKIIRGPLLTSLYDFGKKNKKKFTWISHQHGHGIELSNIHKNTQISKEETLADIMFVYSQVGKKERENNKYKNKNINIAKVGYHNNDFKIKNIPEHYLIYISNFNQELAGHDINMSSLNNFEKVNFEEKLIHEVFSKVNYKILFKEYPGSRSSIIKNNHIKKIIKPYKNIIYFDQWLNAENIYQNSSVILTALPTSGLAGAIKSKKPLIFLDFREIMPLKNELIEIFKNEFFYLRFDKLVFKNLIEIMSLSSDNLNKKWLNKKSMSSSDFEKNYINIKSKDEVLYEVKNVLSKLTTNY